MGAVTKEIILRPKFHPKMKWKLKFTRNLSMFRNAATQLKCPVILNYCFGTILIHVCMYYKVIKTCENNCNIVKLCTILAHCQ